MSGCTSCKTVQLHQEKLGEHYTYYKSDAFLYRGDVVIYTLQDGTHERVTVQRTTPQGIITSTSQFIPYQKMVSLKRKELSIPKTAAAAGAGSALAALAIFGLGMGAGFCGFLKGSARAIVSAL